MTSGVGLICVTLPVLIQDVAYLPQARHALPAQVRTLLILSCSPQQQLVLIHQRPGRNEIPVLHL